MQAVDRVLDGRRTGRFDLSGSDVDSDERRMVGVQLQYAVLDVLSLAKTRPLDTHILGIPLDLKATIADNWAIPEEAQCQLCLLLKIDTAASEHSAWLMRTHACWLRPGRNKDGKRGIRVAELRENSIELFARAPLPRNPLSMLDPPGLDAVFAPGVGLKPRLLELFKRLPGVVIPRSVITTVGFGLEDPLRRAREAKQPAERELALRLLCGKWVEDREVAAESGFDLGESSWVALSLKGSRATERLARQARQISWIDDA